MYQFISLYKVFLLGCHLIKASIKVNSVRRKLPVSNAEERKGEMNCKNILHIMLGNGSIQPLMDYFIPHDADTPYVVWMVQFVESSRSFERRKLCKSDHGA